MVTVKCITPKTKNLPLTITSNEKANVIKIYYVKAEFGYSIEYYYGGQIDETRTEKGKAIFQDVINRCKDKGKEGYKFEKTENLPLTITSNEKANAIFEKYFWRNICYKRK